MGVMRLLADSNLTGIDTGRQRQIITKQLIASADEQRFNILAVDVLIRSELLSFRYANAREIKRN